MPERIKASFLLLVVCVIVNAFLPAEQSVAMETQEINADYILNMTTKKFHRIDCVCVKRMCEKNKGYYIGKREELLCEGFVPCRSCYP